MRPDARPQADPRFTFHASRFTVPGSEARTPQEDFFSILLDMKISMMDHNYIVNKLRGTWIHDVFNTLRSLKQHVMRRSEGEDILLQRYVRETGKHLNLTKPQFFTEKLFCRMIAVNRGQNPKFTQLTDTYTARAYVGSKVGEQHLVKLLWHGKDPRAIPFDTLPAEYVIKTTHSCGQVIVERDHNSRTISQADAARR